MLSDALHSYGGDLHDDMLGLLAAGTLSPAHASVFGGYPVRLSPMPRRGRRG